MIAWQIVFGDLHPSALACRMPTTQTAREGTDSMSEWPTPAVPPPEYQPYQPYRQPYQPYGEIQPTWPQTNEAPRAAASAPSRVAPRLSKREALDRARLLKNGLIAASVVGFGALTGLAASHAAGVTARQQGVPSSNDAPSFQNPARNDDDNGAFFNQQPGGFGFGNSGSSQAPVSGTTVS